MKKVIVIVFVLCLLTPIVIGIHSLKGSSKTIFVPDDYPTITDAVGNATTDDTIFVRHGLYQEQILIINKTLSIIGENAKTTKISLHPPLIQDWSFFGQLTHDYPIKIQASNARLSGFTIETEGGNIFVAGNGSQITNNVIGTGIYAIGDKINILNNTLVWMHILSGSNQIIAQNTIGSNYIVMWIEDSADNVIAENKLSGGIGIMLRSSTRNQVIANNFATDLCVEVDNYFGTTGLQKRVSDDNTFYQNNFMSNSTNIHNAGPYGGDNYSVSNIWDNGSEGNYWSNYNGTDTNGDGIGDTPYIIDSNNQDHYPLIVPIDISAVALQLPEWELPFPSTSPYSSPAQTQSSQSPNPTPITTTTPSPSLSPSPTPSASPSSSPTQQPTLEPSSTPIDGPYFEWIPFAIIALAIVSIGIAVYALRKIKHRNLK